MKTFFKNIFFILLLSLCACAEFSEVFVGGDQPHPPTTKGVYYVVKPGDTLNAIAEKHHSSYQEIAEVNDIRTVETIRPGRKIFIPKSKVTRVRPLKVKNPSTPAPAPVKEPPAEKLSFDRTRFVWPVNGVVTSPFGVRHGRQHDGIDIAAPRGSKVVAAGEGRVVFAGRLSGYGNLVVIKHDENFFTAYGHLSQYSVSKGKKVSSGDQIGQVGNTGRSSGPHCHFEIRQKTQARNPLFFLPPK